MATLLWGKVYYQDTFAGFIRQEPGGGSSFVYDSTYLQGNNPAIAHALSLQVEPFVYQTELPPFFDNLVAEGWLEQAQSRLLGKRIVTRFELLLAFGHDCAGAVSVVDSSPERLSETLIDIDDPKEKALLTSRASLSGVQPKLAIIEKQGFYYPVNARELSTHIAKFPSNDHIDLVANEYLTTMAFKILLPDEALVEMHVGKIHGFDEDILIIKRFDRAQGQRIHFEEFNQLFDQPSNTKYMSSYKKMAEFIRSQSSCLAIEVYHLYLRVLAGILLGNTDMHLKNFAMFHTNAGLRLTPVYDQVAAALYGYKQLALAIDNTESKLIAKLSPYDLISLGAEFRLDKQAMIMAIQTLERNYEPAKHAVMNCNFGSESLKQKIVQLMSNIWNETFASIGRILSQRQ